MKTFNFLSQYAKSAASDNITGNLVNWYLEESKEAPKYKVIARPTPGLTVFNSDSGSVVRKLFRFNDVVYSVVDDKFYSYTSDGTRSAALGTLNTSTGGLDICAIDDQIMIVDGTNGYIFTVSTTTFATITDSDFPANPITATAQDGFFLVAVEDSSDIYGSDISNGLSWSALSLANSTGSGDYITKLFSHRREVWVMGAESMEVWVNTGAPTFSFEPNQSIYIHTGLAAIDSPVICDNNIYLLGQQLNGSIAVYKMISDKGYIPEKISTREIDYLLSTFTTYNDALGYTYMQSGHEFYILAFPTEGVTLVYDLTTETWHERQSTINGSQTRHLSNCSAFCYGLSLVGAFNSGTIYYFDEDVYTDNTQSIYRELVSPPGYTGYKIFLDKLQIDMQTNVGSNKTMNVSLSKDSGQTYTALTDGTIPSAGNRMFWSRLGMTQDGFVIKMTTTSDANTTILGAKGIFREGVH